MKTVKGMFTAKVNKAFRRKVMRRMSWLVAVGKVWGKAGCIRHNSGAVAGVGGTRYYVGVNGSVAVTAVVAAHGGIVVRHTGNTQRARQQPAVRQRRASQRGQAYKAGVAAAQMPAGRALNIRVQVLQANGMERQARRLVQTAS